MLNRSTTCCWLVPVNGEELELVVTVVGLVGWSLALRAFTLYLLVSLITVHCQSRRWQARHVAKSQLTGKSWLLCNPNKLLRARQRDQKNGTWNNKKVILTAQSQGERIIDQIYCPGFCPHSSAGASWIKIEEGCVSKRFTCWDVFIERVKKKNFRKWTILSSLIHKRIANYFRYWLECKCNFAKCIENKFISLTTW